MKRRSRTWIRIGDHIAFALMALILTGGFLTLGYVYDGWPRALAWMGCALLGIWSVLGWAAGRWDGCRMHTARWVVAVMLLPVVWAGIQIMPLPAGVVTAVSPPWEESVEAFAEAGVPVPDYLTIATAPYDGYRSWSALLASLFFFVAAAQMVARRDGLMRIVWLACLFGVLEGLAGVVTFAFGDAERAHGPVYNPNHHAALILMTAPLCLIALLNWRAERIERIYEMRGRPPSLFQDPIVGGLGLLLLALAGWLAAFSRGSLLLGGSVIACWATYEWRQHRRNSDRSSRSFKVIYTMIAAIAVVFALGAVERFIARFTYVGTGSGANRQEIWSAVLEAIGSSPIVGLGPEGTTHAINRYIDIAVPTVAFEAHSDWLQPALEMGLPAYILLLVLIGFTVRSWLLQGGGNGNGEPGRAGSRSDGRRQQLRRAATAGVVATLAHALVDFHLRIPLVGLVFMMVVAVAVVGWENGKWEMGNGLGTEGE